MWVFRKAIIEDKKGEVYQVGYINPKTGVFYVAEEFEGPYLGSGIREDAKARASKSVHYLNGGN